MVEAGYGFETTTFLFNEYRKSAKLPEVCLSTVRGAIHCLDPKYTPKEFKKQGSYDPDSAWAKRRLDVYSQKGAQLGCVTPAEQIAAYGDNEVPPMVKIEAIREAGITMTMEQICYSDEKHWKCVTGLSDSVTGIFFYIKRFKQNRGKSIKD